MLTDERVWNLLENGFRRSTINDFIKMPLAPGETVSDAMLRWPWMRDGMPYSEQYILDHSTEEIIRIHERFKLSPYAPRH